jgi:hypothetical protein
LISVLPPVLDQGNIGGATPPDGTGLNLAADDGKAGIGIVHGW